MHFTAFGVALALATAPAVHAQQLAMATPAPVEVADPRPVETPAAPEVDATPVHAEAVEVRREAVEAEATRQTSARSLFTIIGVVVVVLALVSFLT